MLETEGLVIVFFFGQCNLYTCVIQHLFFMFTFSFVLFFFFFFHQMRCLTTQKEIQENQKKGKEETGSDMMPNPAHLEHFKSVEMNGSHCLD